MRPVLGKGNFEVSAGIRLGGLTALRERRQVSSACGGKDLTHHALAAKERPIRLGSRPSGAGSEDLRGNDKKGVRE